MSKERELIQVNVRLYADDVEAAKKIAARDKRGYHAVLREMLSEAMRRRTKVEVR